MNTIERILRRLSGTMNALAAVAVLVMMLLTCADVVLRLFRRPIPGTYELVGFMGALFVSFSLAQTALDRGHIAVDFLVRRLPEKAQQVIEAVNAAICAVLFSLICHQAAIYAAGVRQAGEVSMTLQMPLYPIVYGISAGCAMLGAVLAYQCVRALHHVFGNPVSGN